MNRTRGSGCPVTVTAPSTLTGNQMLIALGLAALVAADAASGAPVALWPEGEYFQTKKNDFTVALGQPLYWSATNSRFENNKLLPCVGVATQAATETSTEVFFRFGPPVQVGYNFRKNNLGASARPAATDDTTDGYEVGSEWQYLGVRWVCTDATADAAHWKALNPILTSVTVVSGQTSKSTAVADIPGIANGDTVLASVKTKGANSCYITGADVTGGNLVVNVNTDPGTGGAVCNVAIWPAAV